jgi:hypothetical protein
MNKILISLIIITSMMGWALAVDAGNVVGNQPGEAVAENLFNHGIGQPWVGGNPPSSSSFRMRNSSPITNKEHVSHMPLDQSS